MSTTLTIQDLRNLIASVTLNRALVKKFEEKPFTVGSANSSVKMFSSLIGLYSDPISKITSKEQTFIADGLGQRVSLSSLNKEFSSSFAKAKEEEVLPNDIIKVGLESYQQLLKALKVIVAIYSEKLVNELSSLSERELEIIDECRTFHSEYVEEYHKSDEAHHFYDEEDPDSSLSKEMAKLSNTDTGITTSSSDTGSASKVSADFRIRD